MLAQKEAVKKIRPIQYANRTTNSAERKYFACEREELAVISALPKVRLYLVSEEPFLMLTSQAALKTAFEQRNIHGRLARWLDFLAGNDFQLQYRKEDSGKAADFLSRISHGENSNEQVDETDLFCITRCEDFKKEMVDGSKEPLQDAARSLAGLSLTEKTETERSSGVGLPDMYGGRSVFIGERRTGW